MELPNPIKSQIRLLAFDNAKLVPIRCHNICGSSLAGAKLKAKSGWNKNGNGTDQYGFSALPGGYGGSDGSFGDVGLRTASGGVPRSTVPTTPNAEA